ncbi:unnamed protein product, partial [Laminaria digitata]
TPRGQRERRSGRKIARRRARRHAGGRRPSCRLRGRRRRVRELPAPLPKVKPDRRLPARGGLRAGVVPSVLVDRRDAAGPRLREEMGRSQEEWRRGARAPDALAGLRTFLG